MLKLQSYIWGVVLLSFVCSVAHAQTITPILVGSGGTIVSGGGNTLSYSIGEPLTNLLTNGANMLTQGYQQPSFQVTATASNNGPICANNRLHLPQQVAARMFEQRATTASTTVNPTSTTTYTVSVTNAGSTNTATTSVVVNASPTLSIGNIIKPTCSNANGSMMANVTGGVSPYTRLWSNGSTATTISNLSAATYTVTVTGANGCTVSASTSISNTTLAVPTNLTTTNITGTTATFNWSAVTGAANYTIRGRRVGTVTWTTIGPVTGTSKNIHSQISCGKTYEWKVRANCAGGLTSSAYSSTPNFTTRACPTASGKTNAEWDGGFKTFSLSPNPANSLVTLYYNTETETPLNISIIDLTGRVVLQQNTLAKQGDNTINLTTNQLPQGYYLVELNDGTAKMHEKLVIAR
ncbi:MAG: T9SS type A sorting domain-containing protein [Sphingobacteriales bacterium]|nr:T9SS type A sorting domain-containing protein [Sphingobacteriales bacterium]